MAQKPSTPKGTRDFSTLEMARRNYIFDTIRSVFRLFGYRQIETPALENLSTLMGKYGEEGDKLLFKVLNSGDFLAKVDASLLENRDSLHTAPPHMRPRPALRPHRAVRALRGTAPRRAPDAFQALPDTARVARDRPQKGRYREFYQCDADVVGSDSLINEVELLQIIDEVFARLNIRVAIKLNNRKILAGISELIGAPDKLIDITVAIDKIDKIGLEKVNEELAERGLSAEAIEQLRPILEIGGTTAERLEKLASILASSETGTKGVEELRFVVGTTETLGLRAVLDLDVSLARGLNYYTGTIIEVKALDTEIGSISGGGRYDNLTGVFGMDGLSGVGVSFGADRIYDVLNALGLFPDDTARSTRVLFANFGEAEALASLRIIKELRAAGVATEIYPDASKMKKQIAYANALGVPFFAMVGETELANGTVALKNMATGEQNTVAINELAAAVD